MSEGLLQGAHASNLVRHDSHLAKTCLVRTAANHWVLYLYRSPAT